LNGAHVWSELSPSDKPASRSIMLLQLGTNRVDEAMPALKAFLADVQAAETANPGLGGSSTEKVALDMLQRIPDKNKAYQTGI